MQSAISEPRIKITCLKTAKNPELEQIRESVLSQNVNYNDKANQLKEQLRQIHAAYLFGVSGKHVLATLCKVISSTPSSPYFSSWKDLASLLSLSNHQIGCIEQYKFVDPTELVLKAYSLNWESTLDEIISVLQTINRFDAIVEAEDGLLELARLARKEQVKRTEDVNEGIHPIFGKGTSDGILRPEFLSALSYQLPITLRSFPEKAFIIREIEKCELKLQNSSIAVKKKEKKISKAVMLTFAADAEEIAWRLARELRKARGKHLPIGVLILEEQIDKVQESPEQFISHVFPQMHYIIPILTKGYFEALSNGAHHQSRSFSIVDAQYVKFIYDLMIKEYVNKNDCKNKRVRCIIPDSQVQSVLNHKHMEFDPILKVWEKESDLENLACRILKIRRKDSSLLQ